MRGPALAFPEWLSLREPADAAARATDLVEEVRRSLTSGDRVVVHDLGCGAGSMARWLAPRLPGPQHWVMYDRDDDLLTLAAGHPPAEAADGAPVTLETRRRDITRLGGDELAGASLVTASALLDMFTGEELDRFVALCAAAGCPSLIALTVTGQVELSPRDPLDDVVAGAFNVHQRRATRTGRRLGPDAAGAAVDAFTARGMDVLVRASPWRLGPERANLVAEWFLGWVAAAREQQPELAGELASYTGHRLAEAAAGRLSVTVHHEDLLARLSGDR